MTPWAEYSCGWSQFKHGLHSLQCTHQARDVRFPYLLPTTSADAKPRRAAFPSASAKATIAADSGEVESKRDETFDGVDISGQYARRFSRRPDAFAGILDSGLHLRMAGIAKLPEVRRQVARSEEEAINTFDGRDCLDLLQRSFALQLHQDAGVKVRVGVISLNPTVVVRT